MTKIRQLNIHLDAKQLAKTLIKTPIRARHLTIDTAGSWEKFIVYENCAFLPFLGNSAVYPGKLFFSLVDRISELEMAVVLGNERYAWCAAKTAPWPPPREAAEWTLRSIRGRVVTRV